MSLSWMQHPHASGLLAWHSVVSPGGYEWIYFDGEDASGEWHWVAIITEGFIFDPALLRAQARFSRSPKRNAPPHPRDHAFVYLAIYRHGRVWRQFIHPFKGGVHTDDRPGGRALSLGSANLAWDGTRLAIQLRGRPWELSSRGPRAMDDILEARIEATPRGFWSQPPLQFIPGATPSGEHLWSPMCPNMGFTARLQSGGGAPVEIAGTAYHDTNRGSTPLGEAPWWFWGRWFDGSVTRIVTAWPAADGHTMGRELSWPGSLEEARIGPVSLDPTSWSAWGVRYPTRLRFCDGRILDMPKVIDTSPFYLRLAYRVDGRPGVHAFCEFARPGRLRWPILGRLVGLSLMPFDQAAGT